MENARGHMPPCEKYCSLFWEFFRGVYRSIPYVWEQSNTYHHP